MDGLLGYVFFCLFGIAFFVQGLALFCAGLTSPRSALSQLSYSLVAACTVLIQYFLVGYSIESSSSRTDGGRGGVSWQSFVGDFSHVLLRNVDFDDAATVAELLLRYAFAVVPACLLASAACQRGRFVPLLAFIAAWMTCVYCPVAYWCWHPNGWSHALGALDYAGGSIIHITAGFGALVYSLVLGPRAAYLEPAADDSPNSLTMVLKGTMMMWMGWIGFTGGAQYDNSAQALRSVVNTLLSASMGGFAWMILDYCTGAVSTGAGAGVHGPQGHITATTTTSAAISANPPPPTLSLVSFCSGVISGLVSITPGAGYVSPSAALLFGLLGGLGCNLATRLKFYIGVDDPLDVFAVHGLGGMIGTLLTGVFALARFRTRWQTAVQLLSAFSVAAYTLGCTLVIAVTIDSVPWLGLRVAPEDERVGMDLLEHGETALPAATADPSWLPASLEEPSLDRSRALQVNQNAPMYPSSFDHLLLQRLPLSYGSYTRRQ